MADPCRPAFRKRFEAFAARNPAIRAAGCGLVVRPEAPDFGFVNCSPEHLRADAERQLRALGFWPEDRPLPLDVYSAARNVQSEQGDGSIEERVALVLSTAGAAARRKISVTTLILRNKFGRQQYGAIHGPGTGTSTAPFGRFTASSKDPHVADILIADFVLSGGAGAPLDVANFARGADDQAASSAVGVTSAAAEHSYWVGNIPGINPHRLMLMKVRKDVAHGSATERDLIRQAQAMKVAPPPDWSRTPTCPDVPTSAPGGVGTAVLVVGLGTLAGAALAFLLARMGVRAAM